MEKGNKVDVILLRDGQETPAKMVANPRMTRLDFYDRNGQSLIVRKVEKQAAEQTQKADMTPQEVQKAAISRTAEQKQEAGQQTNQSQAAKESVSGEQGQNKGQANNQQQAQKETANEQAATEQKQDQRRRHGVRM